MHTSILNEGFFFQKVLVPCQCEPALVYPRGRGWEPPPTFAFVRVYGLHGRPAQRFRDEDLRSSGRQFFWHSQALQ